MSESKLETELSDVTAALCRGIAGAAPVLGALVGEAITAFIPGQKMERVVDFIKQLDARVEVLERDVDDLCERFRSPEFLDLLEDGMIQASRALSPGRRQLIACLVASALTDNDISYSQRKKLLRILEDLTDEELIMLKYASLEGDERKKFKSQHKNLLYRSSKDVSESNSDADWRELQVSYQRSLVAAGLLEDYGPRKVTRLGRLLLRHVLDGA